MRFRDGVLVVRDLVEDVARGGLPNVGVIVLAARYSPIVGGMQAAGKNGSRVLLMSRQREFKRSCASVKCIQIALRSGRQNRVVVKPLDPGIIDQN